MASQGVTNVANAIINKINNLISSHNNNENAHQDIRESIPSATSELNNNSGFITSSSIPNASSATPSADTTNGSVGTGTAWARSDHTHPKSSLYAESTHTHDEYIQNQECYFDDNDFVVISDEQTITKTLTIQWNDSDNERGLRPRYLQVTINGITAYLSEESEWSVSVPVDTEGSYTWSIPSVLGYTIISQDEVNNVTTFVATQTTPKTLIIQWNDNNDAARGRPSSVRATINGITAYLSEESDWSASVLVDTEESYRWAVQSVVGYTQSSYNEVDNVTTVTLFYRKPPAGSS